MHFMWRDWDQVMECLFCMFNSTGAVQCTFDHHKALCLPGTSSNHVGVILPAETTSEADNASHHFIIY